MPTTVDGNTGVSQVQDGSIQTADIVNGAVTAPKLSGGQTGTAPIYGARAWCLFNGTLGGTIAPTAGGNITSITKNGTGDYTVTMSTPMLDANYNVLVTPGGTTGVSQARLMDDVFPRTTTTFRFMLITGNGAAAVDASMVSITVFR